MLQACLMPIRATLGGSSAGFGRDVPMQAASAAINAAAAPIRSADARVV